VNARHSGAGSGRPLRRQSHLVRDRARVRLRLRVRVRLMLRLRVRAPEPPLVGNLR